MMSKDIPNLQDRADLPRKISCMLPVVEALAIPMDLYDPDGNLLFSNKAARCINPLETSTQDGAPYNIIAANKGNDEVTAALQRAFQQTETALLPDTEYAPASTSALHAKLWLRSKASPICNPDNTLLAVLVSHEDITELKSNEYKFRSLVEDANEAILVIQGERLKYFNRKALDVTGYTVSQFLNTPFHAFIHPEDRPMVVERYGQRLAGQDVPTLYQFRIIDAAGEQKWLQANADRILWEGEPAILAFLPEITHLKEAEKALHESEVRFQMIAETTSDMILLGDHAGCSIFANSALQKKLGYSNEEILNKHLSELIHDKSQKKVAATLKQVFNKKTAHPIEVQLHKRDGTAVDAEINFFILEQEKDRPYLGAIMRDITQRKQTEAELANYRSHLEKLVGERTSELTQANIRLQQTIIDQELAEERLSQEKNTMEAVFAAINDGISVQDDTFHILYQNASQSQQMGDHVGEQCYAAYRGRTEPCEGCGLAECLRQGEMRRNEMTITRNGETGFFELTASPIKDSKGTPIAAVVVSRDMTEHKKLTDQLLQAQKMEAIGTLAGGIAHDFNNILTGILGYAELSKFGLEPSSELFGNLSEIVNASQRAGDLIRQILMFSRQTEFKKHPLHIQSVVKEAVKLLRGTIPSTIEIKQRIDSECGSINADLTQVHQVIMNLCTNAYHAMREGGGTLTISLQMKDIEEDDIDAPLTLGLGRYVCLTVADTGHGMDEATMERIFEPYFTTKKQGEGTGLGLATVHGIVENHDGAISVKSKPGEGTIFEVFFPVIDATSLILPDRQEQNTKPIHAKILFVDDEEMLIRLGSRILKKLGFSVTTENNGQRALQLFKKNPQDFDLLITDQMMPGMTGLELARQCLEIKPRLPIILATGFSEAVNLEKALAVGVKTVLIKPVSIDKMSTTIREVLTDTAGPPLVSADAEKVTE